MTAKKIVWRLDGVDFKTYGVYVSASDGLVSRPKMKAPMKHSWDDYHGDSVDLSRRYYEARQITLSCFIKAGSKADFIAKVSAFERLFDKPRTVRLTVEATLDKPLIYEVYCDDEIEVAKTWNNDTMIGTFKLKLIEPEPVKRVLKHIRQSSDPSQTCTVTLTSAKDVNIYWGDGTAAYDVRGENVSIAHKYTTNGTYYPVITGCIDEITLFETNATTVWERI